MNTRLNLLKPEASAITHAFHKSVGANLLNKKLTSALHFAKKF